MAQMTLQSLFSPEVVADPYPLYRHLRETAPIFHVPDTRLFVLSRYADVQAALRDRRLGHIRDPDLTDEEWQERLKNPSIANLQRTMLLMNPPDHTRLRGLVARAFDARSVAAMRDGVRRNVTELIDGFIDAGTGDLVRLFNHPLPVIVICDLLGVPESDWGDFLGGSRVSGRLVDPTPMTDAELDAANRSTLESLAYFRGLCDERRREPRDDLLTALVQSESEHGRLTDEELTANISLLFAAGHETTVNLLGNALLALFRNRDQLELLRADPSLMPGAVEELVRYDSSVQISGRGAFEDVVIGDVEIPKDSTLLTLLGAANRDPAQFEEPDRLDLTRANVRPMSFGGGIHFCLGAQLARLETAEALGQLLARLPRLELDDIDEPDWKPTITLRGVTTLPATW